MPRWLRAVRAIEGLDQEGLGKYVGKSRTAIAMYETGSPVPPEVISTIVDTFKNIPPAPTGDVVEFLGDVTPPDEVRTILYAGVVPCSTQWGDPLSSEERRPIELKFAGKNRFLCKVSGDSCYPALKQGDLTVWESDEDPADGVIVLAERLEDQACTVKMLDYDEVRGRHVLIPVNPNHQPPDDGEGWRVTARLVGVIRQRRGPERTWYWPPGLRPDDLLKD